MTQSLKRLKNTALTGCIGQCDNPVMSKQRLKEMEEQLKRNPYRYKRDWLGLRVMPQGVIYSMFDDKEMTDQHWLVNQWRCSSLMPGKMMRLR